jgi:uncharacterized protein
MVKIGEFNNLSVIRESDFGYYLDAKTENTSDDILLPRKSALGKELAIGDEVEAFIYKDSKDRLVATLKQPLAKVGDLAYLEVVDDTKIGVFINFGLERDILVPFKEKAHRLEVGKKYLFYIYLDKTERLAATSYIDKHLHNTNAYNIDDEANVTVYGRQSNGNLMVAIDNIYRGIVMKNEYYNDYQPGDQFKVRIRKYFEDGTMCVTPRKVRLEEMNDVEQVVLKYLEENNNFMKYNDKSSPEEIKEIFHTSKNSFKRALGALMKKGIIIQDSNGTTLK